MMILIATDKLSKDFSAEIVLEDIDVQIQTGQKIALLGPNGSGKTTLLKMLAGVMEPSSGQVMVAKGCGIAYQSQIFSFTPNNTVFEEGLSVFASLKEMEQQLRQMEQDLNQADEPILDRYAQLSHKFEELGGYSYPARTRSVLHGLGFGQQELEKQVHLLSGGQQSRLALAKLLLSSPDVLLLDEPTNHLDIAAINWLEGYLQNFDGGLLMVSHDRRFLESLADTVWEVSGTRLEKYSGNYSFYRQERQLRWQKHQKEYTAQQQHIQKTEDFIARNIEGQKTKQAQSRRRELEKLQRIAPPPPDAITIKFQFEQRRPSGRHVLDCRSLGKSFGHTHLFTNISFKLERGQRAGLIGPNGCGKTTLLEIIYGRQTPDKGEVVLGPYVEMAYFSQTRTDLQPTNSSADEIWSVRPGWTRGEVQSFLARFLFRGDDAFKLVKNMSGGEASRLALAKLLLGRANFLILDEPTNHLDIDSKEVLEQALLQYPGTVLMVSHDRWFLNKVSDITLDMSARGVTRYLGNYDYMLTKKEQQKDGQQQQVEKSTSHCAKERKQTRLSPNEVFRRRQEAMELERKIAKTEQRQGEINEEIAQGDADHQLLHKLTSELDQVQAKLKEYYIRWESLLQLLEDN